jgi:hypothetical protein
MPYSLMCYLPIHPTDTVSITCCNINDNINDMFLFLWYDLSLLYIPHYSRHSHIAEPMSHNHPMAWNQLELESLSFQHVVTIPPAHHCRNASLLNHFNDIDFLSDVFESFFAGVFIVVVDSCNNIESCV